MIRNFIRDMLFAVSKNSVASENRVCEIKREIQEADTRRAMGVATDMSRGSVRRHLEIEDDT